MLFNSFEFLIFFPVVCLIYYLLKGLKWRNMFLLVASYYFYMNWKPVYALLILTSTVLTYGCGLLVEKYTDDQRKKKVFLVTSLVINFAILFLFKYFNFIGDSITAIFFAMGISWQVPNLDVLLPVGISFYTFQAVGYSIDVYRGTIKAERNFFTYALFVSFFPQLVAGPIERAKNLLPQFHEEHRFDYSGTVEGLRMMLWGYFMKSCVADTIAPYVDKVYNNMTAVGGVSILIATILFTFQIYCDFGGYSLIARGAAKVMGFNLMENFHRPYLSLSVKEFWKRWHISLSSWFMDYVYIPLGGNRVKYCRHLSNLFITFLVSGVWHGANWTFVLWGAWHGVFIVVDNLFRKYSLIPKPEHKITKILCIPVVFMIAVFGWVFFRANNVQDAFFAFQTMFRFDNMGGAFLPGGANLLQLVLALSILIAKDIKDEYGLNINGMHSKYTIVRFLCYYLLIGWTILHLGTPQSFIYFQF